MIDWLAFVAPLSHERGAGGPFYAGEVLATKPDPKHPSGSALDWSILRRMSMEGRYGSTIQVRSTTDEMGRPAIWVSGNPAKWFQGHNVFGTGDLSGLVLEVLGAICKSAKISPTVRDLDLWRAGAIKLTRVDVAHSFDLGSLSRVRNALRSLDSTAHLKHRGRGHFEGDSLTFGSGSRRWSLMFYAKGAEIAVKGHHLPSALTATALPEYAQGLLRTEVRSFSLQLVKERLESVACWSEKAGSALHSRLLTGLQIAEATMLDAQALDGLPPRLFPAYQMWFNGHDLRGIYPKNTFYRHRTAMLKHGIDIAVKQEQSPNMKNVVPLRTVLQAHPVDVPNWAVGTPLYFEPGAKAA